MKPKYFCVVCGYKTLESYHDWDICPICFWEDDVLGDEDSTSPSNQGMWISEAQANFIKFGAVSKDMRQQVRPPTKNDVRRPDFKPFDPSSRGRAPATVASRPAKFPKRLEPYLKERIVPILTPIDDYVAHQVIAQVLFLNRENKRKPIHMLIDSPGGYVASCLAIYDTISRPKDAPVHTYGLRQASGLAALLVAGGARGLRACLPDSRFRMIACSGGKAADEIELPRIQSKVEEELAKLTGQKAKQIHQDMMKERELDAESAVAYGLVDKVVDTIPGPRT